MNTFALTASILSTIIVICLILIVTPWLWDQYKKGAFFCFLPQNHTALVELNGKPIHWLMHKSDKEATEKVIEYQRSKGYITENQYSEVMNRVIKRIKIREEGKFYHLSLWLVKLFNLHWISFNPFARIKPVEVIRTGLKESYDPESPLSEHMKLSVSTPEKFLRLAWPRTNYIPEVELTDQVKVNLITTATKVRVWNLHQIYYELSGKVSENVDAAIASAFIQLLGGESLGDFQTADMTAKAFVEGEESLVANLRGKGLEAIGAYLEGGVAVSDWELGKDQERIRIANLARAAAEAEKEVVVTVAKGVAESTLIKGKAEADVMALKGTAFAKANQQLVEAYGADAKSAANVAVAQELSKPGSNVRAIGGNSILNLD